MIQTLHDTGDSYQITPKMDGGTYGTAIADCVCRGIGDEFRLNYSSSSRNISFTAGSQAVIGGAFFKITSDHTVQNLKANATLYICATIDLSQAPGSTGSITVREALPLNSGNLNDTTSIDPPIRDMLLYTITTSANGVSSVQDKRQIRGDGNAINGYSVQIISQNDYDALATKDLNTLYFVYEVE